MTPYDDFLAAFPDYASTLALDELRATLRWGSLEDAATRRALWELNGLGYTADPHTAVAYGVLEERRGLGEPAVVLATAHPAKFADLLKRDMNLDLALPPALAEAQTLPLQAQPLEAREEALKDDAWEPNNEIGLEMSLSY